MQRRERSARTCASRLPEESFGARDVLGPRCRCVRLKKIGKSCKRARARIQQQNERAGQACPSGPFLFNDVAIGSKFRADNEIFSNRRESAAACFSCSS